MRWAMVMVMMCIGAVAQTDPALVQLRRRLAHEATMKSIHDLEARVDQESTSPPSSDGPKPVGLLDRVKTARDALDQAQSVLHVVNQALDSCS
jgi:hypothetical protein